MVGEYLFLYIGMEWGFSPLLIHKQSHQCTYTNDGKWTHFLVIESHKCHYADDKAWDVLLLDIEMGAMDGISLAKKIRQDNAAVQIVFITGFAERAS